MDNRMPVASLRDLVTILFRRKLTILVLITAALSGALFWVLFLKNDVYVVSAKVLVRVGREQGVPPTMLDQRGVFLGDRSHDVNSEVEMLHNVDLIAQVVDSLRLAGPPLPEPPPVGLIPTIRSAGRRLKSSVGEAVDSILVSMGLRTRVGRREMVIHQLKQALSVTPRPNSNVILVHLATPTRVGSADVLNTLLDLYVSYRAQVFDEAAAVTFFRSQANESAARLRELERSLATFEASGGLFSIEEQEAALLQQMIDRTTRLNDARIALERSRDQVRRLGSDDAGVTLAAVGQFQDDAATQQLLDRIAQLEQEYAGIRTAWSGESQPAVLNRSQLDAVANVLASKLLTVHAERRHEYDLLEREVTGLRAALDTLHSMAGAHNRLMRQVKISEDAFLLYSQKLEEVLANQALTQQRISNVTVVEHAVDPLQPLGLRKTAFLALALVLSVMAALAWVTLLEFFDDRIYSPEDLRRTRLTAPVLAVVPAVRKRRRLPTWRTRAAG